MWSTSFGQRFKQVKPRTLGIGLAVFVPLVVAAVVATLVLRKQQSPPEFTGVVNARPPQDTGVNPPHGATKPQQRDEGPSGLVETPSRAESTRLPPPSATPDALSTEANRSILGLLSFMPSGGGWEASSKSMRGLQRAIQVRENQLKINSAAAQTTYSSGATYLVFLQALQSLLPPSTLSDSLAEALRVKGQPDGVGVWGRWNANGPGIACLFNELRLGPNFTSLEDAQPGDFMKAFFLDAVGRREHSLSMIYLGRGQSNGAEMIRVWSSMKPWGYGEAVIPRSRIRFVIFSRLENPANIAQATGLPLKNGYLASLLTTDSSKEEAMAESGAR